MKLKQHPNDFQVEEMTSIQAGTRGSFGLYRLTKSGWTTPDAFSLLRRHWNIEASRLNYAGLKDRHAVTTQYFTIEHGPRQSLILDKIEVKYLGQITHPFTPKNITANRFHIVVRHLNDSECSRSILQAAFLEQNAVPNYFDDQRFGSVSDTDKFIGREMVHGQFETALKMVLCGSYEHDGAEEKRVKQIVAETWGKWQLCYDQLPKSHTRSIVDYLRHHPTDYKGAVSRLRPDLNSLYLSAYQSYLWNLILHQWIVDNWDSSELGTITLKCGEYAVPVADLNNTTRNHQELQIPLPSARAKRDYDPITLELTNRTLVKQGISLDALRIPGLDNPYFSKGLRLALIRPRSFSYRPIPDEFNPGYQAMKLGFELPRGSYATLIVKQLFATKINESHFSKTSR